MLLLYTYINGCHKAYEAVDKEGYKHENFQTICKNKQEAIEDFEQNIKKNKKLKKNATYYVYVTNAYEYDRYKDDNHFVFDYCVGDIKVIEGRIVPDKIIDEDDYCMVEFKESFNTDWVWDYEPLPDDVIEELKNTMEDIENIDTINIDKPYDLIEKKDEINASIDSALNGGKFKPITIKLSDEVAKKYEENDARFHKEGFRVLQNYLSEKAKGKKS